MQQTDQIERLRSSVREEKGIISRLDETITDAGLKAILNLASNWLGDVENFFLNTKILQEPRTERAWQTGSVKLREWCRMPYNKENSLRILLKSTARTPGRSQRKG